MLLPRRRHFGLSDVLDEFLQHPNGAQCQECCTCPSGTKLWLIQGNETIILQEVHCLLLRSENSLSVAEDMYKSWALPSFSSNGKHQTFLLDITSFSEFTTFIKQESISILVSTPPTTATMKKVEAKVSCPFIPQRINKHSQPQASTSKNGQDESPSQHDGPSQDKHKPNQRYAFPSLLPNQKYLMYSQTLHSANRSDPPPPPSSSSQPANQKEEEEQQEQRSRRKKSRSQESDSRVQDYFDRFGRVQRFFAEGEGTEGKGKEREE